MEYTTIRILKKDNHTAELVQPSNGGTVCDCYNGPCSCGAWHNLFNNKNKKEQHHCMQIFKFMTELTLLKHLDYKPVNFKWQNISDF